MTWTTIWERWKTALLPRDREERDRMRELDAASTGPGRPCRPGYYCHHNHPELEGGPRHEP